MKGIYGMTAENLINLTKNKENFDLDENYMLKLTKDNFALIKEQFLEDQNLDGEKYQVIKECVNKEKLTEKDYKFIAKKIAAINSTHSSDASCSEFAKLANSYNLMEAIINGSTDIADTIINDMARKERSLVSKVCRYLETWKTQNFNFTINDSILRTVLPYYFKVYNMSNDGFSDSMEYTVYLEYCKTVLKKTDIDNLHEMDFLIWYFYHQDSIRLEIIKALK